MKLRNFTDPVRKERGVHAASAPSRKSGVESTRPTGWFARRSGINAALRRERPEAGIALIECMIYCGLLFLVLGLAFAVFDRAWENSRNLRDNTAEMTRALTTGERWREDVRHAAGPLRVEETAEGQVLHIPCAGGGIDYRVAQESVWRRPAEGATWIEVLNRVKSSRMQPDPRTTVTAWRWELELKNRDKNPRHQLLLAFESVPPQTERP